MNEEHINIKDLVLNKLKALPPAQLSGGHVNRISIEIWWKLIKPLGHLGSHIKLWRKGFYPEG